MKPGDIVFGDADGVVILPEDFEELLTAAEKMTRNEMLRAQRVEKEGYKFLQRDDFDVVKFFEYDKQNVIGGIKKNCTPD